MNKATVSLNEEMPLSRSKFQKIHRAIATSNSSLRKGVSVSKYNKMIPKYALDEP